jgi:hypothetical protein
LESKRKILVVDNNIILALPPFLVPVKSSESDLFCPTSNNNNNINKISNQYENVIQPQEEQKGDPAAGIERPGASLW